MKSIPENKRLQVTFARHVDDRQIRGVKQTLPKKKLRDLTEDEFHEFFGHMGSGRNCLLCMLIKGTMRFIYSIVDVLLFKALLNLSTHTFK